jgi:hypothetical protein
VVFQTDRIDSEKGNAVKAAVFHGTDDIRLTTYRNRRSKSRPTLLARLACSAICGTDLHMIRGSSYGMQPGTILGHKGDPGWLKVKTLPPKRVANHGRFRRCMGLDGLRKTSPCQATNKAARRLERRAWTRRSKGPFPPAIRQHMDHHPGAGRPNANVSPTARELRNKSPRMSQSHVDPERAKAGAEEHREKDPHGSAPGKDAAKERPKAMPSGQRHETETANHKPDKPGG